MKTWIAPLAAASAAAAVLIAGEPYAQDSAPTVWSGVYSEAQAERGQAAYAQNCGKCHGASLAGLGEAKPLAGPEFMATWNGLSVGDLYDRARNTMPLDKPRGLPKETYADITAFVLKFNGFPAGRSDLAPRSEVLAGIRIDAYRPRALLPALVSAARAEPKEAPPQNDGPNPYKTELGVLQAPPGRVFGSSSGVAVDSRGHVWVADRCGANSCAGSDLDPILEFDAKGRFLQGFGKGLFLFPHGLYVDSQDHVWVTDQRSDGTRGAQVFKFDRKGQVLLTLGKAGVSREGPDTFFEPTAVVTAKDGTIFVADGHTAGKGASRIVKFDKSGRFLKQWGEHGTGPGQMDVPHALALDSRGRLFVGDRWNNRIQIFDQDGKLLDIWTQFSRPSGLFVDRHDQIYVADSESRAPEGYGHHPGWRRGIRIGDARTGRITAFIPDPELNPDKGATSGAEGIWVDLHGVIWGAQVFEKRVVRYTP